MNKAETTSILNAALLVILLVFIWLAVSFWQILTKIETEQESIESTQTTLEEDPSTPVVDQPEGKG